MTFRTRVAPPIACGVISLLLAAPALAQDHLGNAMSPQGASAADARDPDGLGITEHARTPTGWLQLPPWTIRTPKRSKNGWLYDAHVEFGGLVTAGDTTAAKFREYKDLDSGPYLNHFGVTFEKPDAARYVQASGGGLGRSDQFLRVEAGTYNAWKIRGFFTEIPHVFTSTYRSIWSGLGTDTLALDGLPPGGGASAAATQTTIQAALDETSLTGLGLTRKRGGARVDFTLPGEWKAFGSYTRERREGTRPFGLVFGGGGGGGNVEPPESIDASTTDVSTGVQLATDATQLNVQGSVSLFRNDIDTLTVENPLFVTLNTITGVPANAFTSARYDLHPDNTAQNLRAEVARRLPSIADSRLTGVISLSRFRQNDALIPWTTSPLAGGTINGVSTTNMWNTAASLTRPTADAAIDTMLVNLGWSLKPLRALDVRAKLRYYDTDNHTEYWACNPLTGQWGRLLNDGTGGAFVTPNLTAGVNPAGTTAAGYNGTGCDDDATRALGLAPSSGAVNLRNVPFAYSQIDAGVTGTYRITRHDAVEIAFERETFDRDYRERERTWEHTAKISYVARSLPIGTFRASYAYGRRRGSPYMSDPYEEFLSASLGPIPLATGANMANWIHVLDQFRKFDLADRDRQTADARLNVAITPTIDAGVSVQVRDLDYPDSSYGRTDHQRIVSPNVDLTWQPTNDLSVGGFASIQRGRMQQAGLQPNACVMGSTYFFFSDGSIQASTTGVAPPAPAGTSLVGTERVQPSNWQTLCEVASATSPLYPLSRTWDVTQRDRNVTLGASAHQAFGKLVLDVDYTFGRGRTSTGYDYNAAALAIPDAQAALAGAGWPDLVFDQHFVDADLTMPIRSWVDAHVIYRYERGRIRDWHYEGVAQNPMPANNAVYLDAGPLDYAVHVVGIFGRFNLK